MPIAFKEWAVTVRALAEGEQLITLRTGEMSASEYSLKHNRFFLYPTFEHHENTDLVRESHQPELRRALEEGVWADGEPPIHACEAGICQPERVRVRAWAEVAAIYTVTDRRCIDNLAPFCVWSSDYAERRLAWNYQHPLHIILLRTHRIPRPVTVRAKEYEEDRDTWVDIQRDLSFEGTPVLCNEEFERASAQISEAVSSAPVLVTV